MNNPYLRKSKKRPAPSSPRDDNPSRNITPPTLQTSVGVGSSSSSHSRFLVTPPSSNHKDNNNSNNSSSRRKYDNNLNGNLGETTQSSSSASALIISASAKAGMEGIDRTRIDAIILEESGNSKFMQQQRRRDEKVNERIEAYRKRLQTTNPIEYAVTTQLEERLKEWSLNQATKRSTCVVIDMDMFYFACEALGKPHLRDVPACVGRSMILTSNYPARRYGVRSAMPGWIGDRLVEELTQGKQRLIHLPSNFNLYKEKSNQVIHTLKEFDPNLRSYSLDEAYLDLEPYLVLFLQQRQRQPEQRPQHYFSELSSSISLSRTPEKSTRIFCDWDHDAISSTLKEEQSESSAPASLRDYSSALHQYSNVTCRQALENIVTFMRRRVEIDTGGLTCSAGIAPNVSLAKIASDYNKPNGQWFVDPSEVLNFIRPLPVRKIPGIGRVTEKVLNAHNIMTVQDLYDHRGLVNWMFQPATREFLLKASIGCMGSNTDDSDDYQGNNNSPNEMDHQKGISRERTFQPNDCWTTLNCKLEDITRMLSQDMVRKRVLAHTITMKVKLDTFDVYSRSRSLKRGIFIQSHQELIPVVASLMGQIRSEHFTTLKEKNGKQSFSCRLLGVRCSNLVEEDEFSISKKTTIERFLSKSPTITAVSAPRGRSTGERGMETIHKRGFADQSTIPDSFDTQKKPESTWRKINNLLRRDRENADDPSNRSSRSGSRGIQCHAESPEAPSTTTVQCPLCQRSFLMSDNMALNNHIDSCLSGSTVRQAVRESVAIPSDPSNNKKKKRQSLQDWWVKNDTIHSPF